MSWRSVLTLGFGLLSGVAYAADQDIPAQVPVDISIIALGKNQGYTFQNSYAQSFYTYDLDQPGKSNCNGKCAETWVPVYPTSQKPVNMGDFTLVTRADRTQQWAYKGKPLYTFGFGDHAPPTPKDIQGKWHILQP